jgi:hypothetical protein
LDQPGGYAADVVGLVVVGEGDAHHYLSWGIDGLIVPKRWRSGHEC